MMEAATTIPKSVITITILLPLLLLLIVVTFMNMKAARVGVGRVNRPVEERDARRRVRRRTRAISCSKNCEST